MALAADTTIAVPVYQRQYRWEIDGCGQLLADIRAVAAGHAPQSHFFGPILYTATSSGEVTERMLVDGQQRVATLMLHFAALRDTLGNSDEAVTGQLRKVLLHPTDAGQTRLRLRREGELELDGIVFGRPLPDVRVVVSHLRDNYDYFLEAIRNDALAVWDGLQKLEHVAITLQENANPQQDFENLNSTGAPLRNHELIHNYALMGLTYAQQTEIEDSFWIPIEANTGDAIDGFLRDYLILSTGRDSEFRGEHGVFDVFRKEFPRPRFELLIYVRGHEPVATSVIARCCPTRPECGRDFVLGSMGVCRVRSGRRGWFECDSGGTVAAEALVGNVPGDHGAKWRDRFGGLGSYNRRSRNFESSLTFRDGFWRRSVGGARSTAQRQRT
jgi:hypothetical protein